MFVRRSILAAQAGRWAAVLSLCCLAAGAIAQEFPVKPYVDPSQLEVPWPKYSFYKQPWRGYLETRSGDEFLQGIGVNYNVPGDPDPVMRLLAETGFRAVRLEIGWGEINWEETGIRNEAQFRRILEACRRYRMRPTLLLNANMGVPCPLRQVTLTVASDAAEGDTSVRLSNVHDVVVGRTGIDNLKGYKAAQVIITSVDTQAGECRLSRPLPRALKAGEQVRLSTLKYLPLYPVGTPQFDETAAGWVRYALMVGRLVHDAGIDDFDFEIWNEMSFGSDFLNIDTYFLPALYPKRPDLLRAGGSAWEMAARTVRAVRQQYPQARLIWGFSNTTFFHTAVDKLPPGIEGQSYHPYGTGRLEVSPQKPSGNPVYNLESFVPTMWVCRPEGWASTFVQPESLLRLINPEARADHPPDTTRFYHYMTEHGVLPSTCGVNTETGAWDLKTKVALRSFVFWLGKGVHALDFFAAYDTHPAGMGLLPPDYTKRPAGADFDTIATPPMRALRNLTHAFQGSIPLEQTRPLEFEVTALGDQHQVFAGDATHPPLWDRDEFAVLPFQISKTRFILAVYTKTDDVTSPPGEESYRLKVSGFPEGALKLSYYDPLRDNTVPLKPLAGLGGSLTVELSTQDYPRLLIIDVTSGN